jgi:hypothetical protein
VCRPELSSLNKRNKFVSALLADMLRNIYWETVLPSYFNLILICQHKQWSTSYSVLSLLSLLHSKF